MNHVTAFFHNVGATQLFLFVTILATLWCLEWAVLAQALRTKARHALFNALFIPTALLIQGMMMLLCLGLASWAALNQVGLVYLLPNAENPWIKYGLLFVALDALDYVYHRLMHQIPFFWRFHLAHHTDRIVDVSTTFREHPVETFIRNGFLMLWVLVCGASVELLILRQSFQTTANILAHTALRLPSGLDRLVSWLVVTPNFHHAHHHFQMPATNCNYGDVFSVWDRLFGTYTAMSSKDIIFGLDTHSEYPWLGCVDRPVPDECQAFHRAA